MNLNNAKFLLSALFIFGMTIFPNAHGACIGNNYEQQIPVTVVALPTVDFELPTEVKAGETVSLSANAVVDIENGGSAFFYWCADQGEFVADVADYSTVKFIVPFTLDRLINVAVRVGDALGYIATKTVAVNIISGSLTDFNRTTGDITIFSTDSDVDLTTQGTITLDGQPIQANWTPDGVAFNIYDATGTTFDTFWQPVKLEIHDANGQEIYSGCYPFKDVCSGRWYTRPVMKLWKESVIQGYGEGKSGVFGPNNPALRAELVAAVVRALEQGKTPTPLTEPPFADVSIDDWFAVYVQYAKDTGLIQGCDIDRNLFCPVDSISRAAGTKVVVAAFLKETLARFENGEQPPRLFLDVNDPNEWFYPYIYAAEVENVVDGYVDGNFKLGQDMTRAEMAKVICLAFAKVDKDTKPLDCAEMGEITGRPFIFAVTPEIAMLNDDTTVFTVVGKNLSEGIVFELADCPNVNPIAGGTAEERLFQCTPSNTGGVKNGTLQHNLLYVPVNFTVNVQEQITPKVTSVSPLTATLNQLTTFIVVGSDLPDSLAFEIANCSGVEAISRSPEQQQFQCTPTSVGSQEGAVKDESGNKLKVFFVEVAEPVSEPPVDEPPVDDPPVDDPPVDDPPVDDPPVDDPPVDDPPPDTGCTPSVDSVEPLTVTISEPVTFTVDGNCLPETTAFFLDRCRDMDNLGGTETQKKFRCTPSHDAGIQVNGEIKKEAVGGDGGNVMFNFSVNVEWGTPEVFSVTPTSVNLNEETEFLIKGKSLGDETAFGIGECEDRVNLSRETEEQKFRCTPSHTTGSKPLIFKDGGKVIYESTVDVY
jgi:hypothetical protein